MSITRGDERTGRQTSPLSTLLTINNGMHSNARFGDSREQVDNDLRTDKDLENSKANDEAVTWRSLPHRRQLIILTLARLSEPLVQTSFQAYMFYQLQSFDPTLPSSVIATQAGFMSSSFTGAQFLTAMMWGRISDSEKAGRKMVIMIGLLGTMFSCIGFAFARSFWQAIVCRLLGGILNGNVGVMRTMVSEIVQEKKYQSRAFLLFPMCFNIGIIIGPILGGLLADLAGTYPNKFGHITWLKRFPYAAPNILNAFFLLCGALGVFFGLSETLESLRHKEDLGTKCTRKIKEFLTRRYGRYRYTPVHGYESIGESAEDEVELSPATPMTPATPGFPIRREKAIPRWKNKLPFRRIFTYNVICTLVAHTLLAITLGTFANLWFVFLSTPVNDPTDPNPLGLHQRLPFIFTGGLGLPPREVGVAMSILGIIGIVMQLVVYPSLAARLGVIKSWRIFLYCFPIACALAPFLAIIPSSTPPPAKKDGSLVWMGLCAVLFVQVIGRTFALPATTILVNNATPHPSVLGTMHGIAQSLSSAGRTVGPILGLHLYGIGLIEGVVGAVWWGLAGVAILNCLASNWVKEGDGHEIILDGDDEAEAEWQERRANGR